MWDESMVLKYNLFSNFHNFEFGTCDGSHCRSYDQFRDIVLFPNISNVVYVILYSMYHSFDRCDV